MFTTRLLPGCHTSASAPIVSRHRTLDAAVKKARGNDRLGVYPPGGGDLLYAPPQRDDKQLGRGRYGNGPRRGEPSLAKCIEQAKVAAA